MCDYSLESQLSREAKTGDVLETCRFPNTPTRGFCAPGEPNVAVCLLPGTELAFAEPVRYRGLWGALLNRFRTADRLARFRHVEPDRPDTHHDALELESGRIMMLTMLEVGQRARVLQLPASAAPAKQPQTAGAAETRPEPGRIGAES